MSNAENVASPPLSPEQLQAVAGLLGGTSIAKFPHSGWVLNDSQPQALVQRIIGSDADLCAAIRKALVTKVHNVQVQYAEHIVFVRRWTDASQWDNCLGSGPTELEAIAAAVAQMRGEGK